MTTPHRPEHDIAGSDFGKRGGGDTGPGRARGEHKPSRKHTLEEVLKSLQDLIRNDLLDEPRPASGSKVRHHPAADDGAASVPSPAAPPDNLAGSKIGPPQAGPSASEGEPQGRGGHRLDLPEVIESLKELVATDFDTGDAQAPAAPRRAHPARPAPPGPPEGLQPELPLFDESPAGAPAESPPAHAACAGGSSSGEEERRPAVTDPMDVGGAPVPGTIDRGGDRRSHIEEIVLEDVSAAREIALEGSHAEPGPVEPPAGPSFEGLSVEADLPASSARTGEPAKTNDAAPPAGDEPHHDDIPVLEDIALHAPGAPSVQASPLTPPMGPEQIHAIAVKAVARLNIELRSKGERPLDPKIIKRLEMILREALEKTNEK